MNRLGMRLHTFHTFINIILLLRTSLVWTPEIKTPFIDIIVAAPNVLSM